MGFTLGIERETSTLQIEMEGMNSEPLVLEEEVPAPVEEVPMPRKEPPTVSRAESERKAGQEDPITLFLVGTKTRPMTRSTTKQRPPTKIPASLKRVNA